MYPWGRKGRTAGFSKVDAYAKEFRAFLEALKRAVAANDREGVAALVDLPIGELSRTEFLRRYEELMTPCLRLSIQCATMDAVAEDYMGAWLADDGLLVDMPHDRFQIVGFTGEGRCSPGGSQRE
jgi:hypothetical protein